MATGAAIAAAAIAAASAVDQNQTMRKQDSETAAGIRQNMALQQQANAKVAHTLQEQAKSSPQNFQQSQNQDYLSQLRAQQQNAQAQLMRGGLGAAYSQRARADQSNENSYSNTLAGLLSAVDAPSQQRQQEAYNFGNLGTDLGVIGSDAAGNQFVTGMKVKTTQPNPWLQGLGQAASAYANASG